MIAFSLWSVHIYWYGIMYLLSFFVWYVLLYYGQRSWWYKWTYADTIIEKDLDGFILSLLIGVMIWGRLWHVFIYDFSYFLINPLKIFAFQEWGMSFIGGIVWVVLSVFVYLYYFSPVKWKKIEILSLFDAIVPLVPLWIFFGRFGNYLNQELYGRVVPKDARWLWSWIVNFFSHIQLFHNYDKIDQLLRINTNFLSMAFEGVLLSIIIWTLFLKKVVTKKWNSWKLSAIFLGLYSFIRFVLEYIRQDSQAEFVGWFTRSQWFFVLFIIIAVIWFYWLEKRNK